MKSCDRDELIYALAFQYLGEKANDFVWQRERGEGYCFALGKLLGACTAFDLELEETDEYVSIFTRKNKKIIVKLEQCKLEK